MFRLFLLSLIPVSAGVLAHVMYRLVEGIKPSIKSYTPVRHSVMLIERMEDGFHLDVEHYDAKGEYRRQQYRGGPDSTFRLYPQGTRVGDAALRGYLETYVQQYLWSEENDSAKDE